MTVECELVSEPCKWCVDVTSNLEAVGLEWRISGFDFSVESEGNGSAQLRSAQTMRTCRFATRSSGVYEHTVPTAKSPSWVPSCVAARRTSSGEVSPRALRWRVASWRWDHLGLCCWRCGQFRWMWSVPAHWKHLPSSRRCLRRLASCCPSLCCPFLRLSAESVAVCLSCLGVGVTTAEDVTSPALLHLLRGGLR